MRKTPAGQVKKYWWVEGLRELDYIDPLTKKPAVGRVASRHYHVISAAQEYADALEKSGSCIPGTVVVRTRMGNDKVQGWPLEI